MYNDRYPEMVVGCLKARTIPVNVNHHYTPREVADLLDYVKPRAVIYHRSLGAKFADVLPSPSADLLISVDDGSDAPDCPASIALDDAVAQGDPDVAIAGSPDDLIMYCTGGTTGRPKGVLWRQSDTYVSSMVGADHESADRDPRQGAAQRRPAVVRGVAADARGRSVDGVLRHAGRPARRALRRQEQVRSARWCCSTAEREKVGLMTMVGDAYAAPLVEELQSNRLRPVVAVRHRNRRCRNQSRSTSSALLEKLPQLTIINGYGSSETGNMGFGHNQRGDRTARPSICARAGRWCPTT